MGTTSGMGIDGQFARHQSKAAHVRFGSKADITSIQRDVRFTPESGHSPPRSQCPLSAISGHRANLYSGTANAAKPLAR
jgi:hypothetical protein